MTDSVTGTERRRPTEPLETNASPVDPVRPAPRELKPMHAVSARMDADLLAFVSAKAKEQAGGVGSAKEPAPKAAPANDQILYVGLNDDSAATEAAALRATGARVTTVTGQDENAITVDGQSFDVTKDAECVGLGEAIAKKHGLPPETGKQIGEAIKLTGPSSRDELAHIAMIWAQGEKGGAVPSRLVLSGHSTGSEIHMKTGSLTFHAVLSLGKALPNAARQIEDINFAGCFTAEQIFAHENWTKAFPNVKTMWGYSKYSPSAPVDQLRGWEARTRGRDSSDPNHGTSGVATWSARKGIQQPGVTLGGLRAELPRADARYADYFLGEVRVHSSDAQIPRDDYATFRQLSVRPELPPQERAINKSKADALFRVRFYEESVRGEFAKKHGKNVAAGFNALGLPAPDFAKLTRKEALEAIRSFEAKLKMAAPQPDKAMAVATTLGGLAQLDPEIIPPDWCHARQRTR